MATTFKPQQSLERPLTVADFATFPDDGNRYEIMGGQLFVTPAPSLIHQWVIATLTSAFNTFLVSRQLGMAFPAPTDVQFGEHDIVEPDLVVVLQENLSKLKDTRIIGAPDLLVEITSPSTARRDRVRKAALYAQEGVREYWIVDPRTKTIVVHSLRDGGWAISEAEAGIARSVILPEFSIKLDEVLSYPAWASAKPNPGDNS